MDDAAASDEARTHTEGIQKRPVVLDIPGAGEVIAAHRVGNLTLSIDHCAFDGAYAGFIARMKHVHS